MVDTIKSDPIGLVEYIVKNLVAHKDSIKINPVKGDTSLVLELRVHPDDLGRVIGKGGRIAKSIRNLLNAISIKKIISEDGEEEKFSKIVLEIIDE